MNPRRLEQGFTGTEMMVVVGIVAILAALAAPNMAEMIRIQRLRTATFDVYSSLNLARSEAIKRNTSVIITPVGGNWGDGWRIEDANGNLVKQQSGWSSITLAGPATIGFAGSGRAIATGSINITASDVDASKYRCVRLDASGRAVSKEGSC